MDKKQFLRWEAFAIKMAEHCFLNATNERKEKILDSVKKFFTERRFQNDYKLFWDWDGNNGSECLTDYVDDYYDNHRHWNRREEFYTGKFYNQVTCCIRAGFDVAVAPSGGVLGFTVGDLRRMWNNKVPAWVKRIFEGKFDDFTDSDPVWL